MSLKILFLGYSRFETKIVDELLLNNHKVFCTEDKVDCEFISNFDWIVSFGYRYILKADQLQAINYQAINLHTSYLPFNKGSHPNFWSFIEDTKKGVSIHQIGEGLDTGDIYVQKELEIDEESSTFKSSYQLLIAEIEDLFLAEYQNIFNGVIKPVKQKGKGTYHRVKDLPKVDNWDINIKKYKDEYKNG